MPTKKPTTTYRCILHDAWRVTVERRALWVFGLFAALLSTGGVGETAAKGVQRLATVRDVHVGILRGTFTGYDTFGRVLQDVLTIESARLTASVTLAVLCIALAVIASVVSQGALVAGTGTHVISDRTAVSAGRHAFWHLLGLNFLHKSAQAVLVLLAALPMLALVAQPGVTTMVGAMISYLIALPATVAASIVFVLASIHAVRANAHALDAIHHALALLRSHWLAALEIGLVLFGMIIAFSLGFVALIALASIPFALLVSVSVLVGNDLLFLVVNVLGAGVLVLLVFAFAGAATTFQYATWVRFYEQANMKNRIISKIHRIWHGR